MRSSAFSPPRWTRGDDLRSALQKASVGAGLACTGLGAQTSQPSLVEIETHLDKVNVQPVNL